MKVQCCVCGKIRVAGEWIQDGDSDASSSTRPVRISHGYCPSCAKREMSHFRRQMAQSQLVPG